MSDINDIIKEITLKHLAKVEELTKEQFEDALLGAIKSGDFVRCIQQDYNPFKTMQGLSYIPYREKLELEARITKLQKDVCDVSLVSDMRHQETIATLREALEFPDTIPNDAYDIRDYFAEWCDIARTALKEAFGGKDE